jgi:hypothetical protein
MAFGHASLPTRKYVYGVREFLPRPSRVGKITTPLPPRERFAGHDLALAQMRLAHQFQNRLVELERARRDAIEQALIDADSNLVPLLACAEEAQSTLNALRDQLRAENARTRTILSDTGLLALINAQKPVSTAAWDAYRDARRAAFRIASARTAIKAIDAASTLAKSAARTTAVEGGLYWATAAMVMPRVKTNGPTPRFKRWEGEETISVQFQRKPDRNSPKEPVLDSKGNPRLSPRSGKPMTAHTGGGSLPTASIFVPNTLCWIERSDHSAHVTIHFRVDSGDKGKPVWAIFPATFHRPLPPDAQIKWVHLMRRRIGTQFKWEIAFDVAQPEWEGHPAGDERATEGTLAIALGWRVIDGTVRVAEWIGDDGERDSIRIPDDIVARWRSLESLESIRKRNFNEWHAGVVAFVNSLHSLTDDWQRETANLAQWESPRRLASLVLWWRNNRLPGDDAAFATADGELIHTPGERDHYSGGRKQDKHLADWSGHLRARLAGWRKNFYRKLAIELSCRYKNVAIAEINWQSIAENPEVEDADETVNKTYRAISSCAMLRDCFAQYLTPVAVDAAHIIDDCAECHRRVRHPGRGRWIRCERCGSGNVDRAENAAKNVLARALAANAEV